VGSASVCLRAASSTDSDRCRFSVGDKLLSSFGKKVRVAPAPVAHMGTRSTDSEQDGKTRGADSEGEVNREMSRGDSVESVGDAQFDVEARTRKNSMSVSAEMQRARMFRKVSMERQEPISIGGSEVKPFGGAQSRASEEEFRHVDT
jgi:hypothetical protein